MNRKSFFINPLLQREAKLHRGTANRFNGLPRRLETVETVPHPQCAPNTLLKRCVNERVLPGRQTERVLSVPALIPLFYGSISQDRQAAGPVPSGAILENDAAEAQLLEELLDGVHATVGDRRVGVISPIQHHHNKPPGRLEIALP